MHLYNFHANNCTTHTLNKCHFSAFHLSIFNGHISKIDKQRHAAKLSWLIQVKVKNVASNALSEQFRIFHSRKWKSIDVTNTLISSFSAAKIVMRRKAWMNGKVIFNWMRSHTAELKTVLKCCGNFKWCRRPKIGKFIIIGYVSTQMSLEMTFFIDLLLLSFDFSFFGFH